MTSQDLLFVGVLGCVLILFGLATKPTPEPVCSCVQDGGVP